MVFQQMQAQYVSKVRLLITDSADGKIATIDTLLDAKTNITQVLEKLGYDDATLSKAQTSSRREITIATEEIVELTGQTTSTSNLDRKSRIDNTNSQSMDINNYLAIPPGAKVETLPDGSKRYITTKKDANGTYTEEKTITKGTSEKVADRSGMTSGWVQMEKGKPLPPTVNEPLKWRGDSYEHRVDPLNVIKLNIIIADCDMFDASTLNKKDASLLNKKVINITDFSIKPDFEEEHYLFSFSLPSSETAKIEIFDIVGTPTYEENFSGNYKKFVKGFDLYKKGTFLILVQQGDKKFTQKVTFE